MAGSHTDERPQVASDTILSARIEALKLLADQMAERVLVVGRDLSVIYANRAAWQGEPTEQEQGRRAKCYQAVLNSSSPCDHCGAVEVFKSKQVQSFSCATRSSTGATACGIVQAFPLMGSQGRPEAVLVLVGPDADPSRRVERGESTESDREHADTPEELGLGRLIGVSSPMRELFGLIRLVADSQATVLLQGESGTGKELVARTIHDLSPRRFSPFIVVDCGSLPATLLESELFGHVKGAFTGAVSAKKGLFEEADGGTILLDEIADTSQHFQSKLLRVLQEGEIKPVGSNRSIKVNVRVISATNKNLAEQVKAGVFRDDLYYRLSVLPLVVPPLRERPEDIPLLIDHFLEASCRRHRRPRAGIQREAIQALQQYAWPGNVRQLLHLIERVVVTVQRETLQAEDFFAQVESLQHGDDLRSVSRGAVQQAERRRILEALEATKGNRSKAAKMLKISRANLYNKLRAYAINK